MYTRHLQIIHHQRGRYIQESTLILVLTPPKNNNADGESEVHIIGAEGDGAGFERAGRKTYVLYARELGALRRVHVQQLAASSSDVGLGWYLDRIEVTGPDNDVRTFPCGAWFGKGEGGQTGEKQMPRTDYLFI
jgi:hypothetical protein